MLEYKESLSSGFARELPAFANTSGGKILLGVRDDGTIKGFKDTNGNRAKIQDIALKCDPPVKILTERIGEVTVVTVHESDSKPVQCSDGFFLRQGATTQKLTRDEIRHFFRNSGSIRFDLCVCPRFSYPDDFDRDEFRRWIKRTGISQENSEEDILVNTDAAERSGGRLLLRNGAVLFFAKEPRRFFTQAYITCLLFKGDNKAHVLDRRDFDGGIVADIEDSMRFIERNTRTAYRIEKLQREDVPEYPVSAIREAITNAVMHRDWFIEGANVFVEIYYDRIIISSPGRLPAGMYPKDLGHKNVRRNPLIAEMLHRIGLIEKAGTGITHMRRDAMEKGYPEPEFSADNFFDVIFRPIDLESEICNKSPVKRTEVEKAHYEDHDRTDNDLIQTEFRILKYCYEKEQSGRNLLDRLGYETRTGNFINSIKYLLELGLIEMTIPDRPRSKNQKYRITELGRDFISGKN